MNISKKKYEKLNNDLVDAKAKAFDDVKKALDNENNEIKFTNKTRTRPIQSRTLLPNR